MKKEQNIEETAITQIGDAFVLLIHRTHEMKHMRSDAAIQAIKTLSSTFGVGTLQKAYNAAMQGDVDARGLVLMYYLQGLWDAWSASPNGQKYNSRALAALWGWEESHDKP